MADYKDIKFRNFGNEEWQFLSPYFEYSFDISFGSPTYNKFVVGGFNNEKNWRLYRIPLQDFTKKIGNPELTRIEFMRIWV